MCGIVGIVHNNKRVSSTSVEAMRKTLHHRGPDSHGIWIGKNEHVGFGHARLAIIDLSEGGHQPMATPDGRYTITYNGEMYNYQEIKKELASLGYTFNSTSDTEVLLAAYAEWGRDFLKKLNGMFAFAIWDEEEQTLFAARDPLGEKPFLYYTDEEQFVFASEAKAILAAGVSKREIDMDAVDMALSARYVPAPQTGFTDIQKLPAGHELLYKDGTCTVQEYWNPKSAPVQSIPASLEEWKDTLWQTFTDAVQLRLVSDVSVGAFLSGGIDSSSVVAAMGDVSTKPVETFVISIGGESEDQTYAKLVADHFGTNHHEIALTDLDIPAAVRRLAAAYDQPFFDQSALPSMLISEAMKQHVSVVLSGDGADELFGGYREYQFAQFLSRVSIVPRPLRKGFAALLSKLSKDMGYKAEVLAKDRVDAYLSYGSTWQESLPMTAKYLTKDDLYQGEIERPYSPRKHMSAWLQDAKSSSFVEQAMYADIVGRLADGYLTKVDVASMQHAVEVRAPFLDHRLVALSQHLPLRYKIQGKSGKWIWREIIKEKLPAEVLSRPKMGFSIPLDRLLQNELKDMVHDVLFRNDCYLHRYFKKDTIATLWKDHNDGVADYSNHIWALLMFELWVQTHIQN